MATVIVLNGTSSSGKTTVARAVQEAASTLFLNFSIDSILYALPQSALTRIVDGADVSDLRIAELVRAYYACVNRLLALGHDLVIDHAVTARYHAELLLAAVASHDVLLVRLECPIGTLIERERLRGDRRIGMAAQQQASIHAWLSYDLVIDTATLSPGEAARRILAALEGGGRTALEESRSRLGAA